MPSLEPNSEAPIERSLRSRYVCYGLLLLVLLFFVCLRYRLLTMPLERDEGEYAYAGQLILQGVPPYQLAYNMKLPGTYAAYAVVLAAFGQTPFGIHLGLLLINAAAIVLMYLLATRLLGRLAGIIAAASYALLSCGAMVMGFSTHATHFVVLPVLAGVLLLLRAVESRKAWLFFGSGLLLGAGFIMKQHGIFFLLFGAIYLLKSELQAPVNWRKLLRSAAAFAVGGVLPFAVTCLLLLWQGVFPMFWFWTFDYARQYATTNGVAVGWSNLLDALNQVTHPAAPLWVFALAGLTAILWNRTPRRHMFFLLSFLLFSFLAVCPGLYFRGHYFVLLLPAIALLAGAAVGAASQSVYAWRRSAMLAALPAGLFLIAFAFSIFHQREIFFEVDPNTACELTYGPNPFVAAPQVAGYIASQTDPGARIAVLGSEPEIFFYSHRRSATGYIYTYPLMEAQPYALLMQQNMIAEIEKGRPEMIVFVDLASSWLLVPGYKTLIIDWMKQYLSEHYSLSGIVDVTQPPTYHWGADAAGYQPKSRHLIFVYRRKTG